ncbi:MAG: hypothetical protein V3W20_14495, partial [Candidatus Neomarinimicrobiota bacterium]
MKLKLKIKLLMFITFLTTISSAEWQGQLSTIGDMRKTGEGYISQIGLRYIPTWSLTVPWPTALFDTEISYNFTILYKKPHGGGETTDFD